MTMDVTMDVRRYMIVSSRGNVSVCEGIYLLNGSRVRDTYGLGFVSTESCGLTYMLINGVVEKTILVCLGGGLACI